MLAEAALVRLVAKAIRENGWGPLVVDPVMVSTSGHRLLTTEAEDVIRESLLPLAALVTPNLDEAAVLTGRAVHDVPTMERAGETLLRFGAARGAGEGRPSRPATTTLTDVLVTPDGMRHLRHPRLATTSTHGTGCTLSAAMTAGLALGRPLETAVADALDFVHRAIAAAPGLGAGHGPLDHTVTASATTPSMSAASSPAIRWRSPSPRAWSSLLGVIPAAGLVMAEKPRQRSPRARAAMTSSTVDMPTASAPSRSSIRISAGVS